MKSKFRFLPINFVLVLFLLLSSLPAHALESSASQAIGKDEIPYGECNSSNSVFSTFSMLTEAEARDENVPIGYSGHVLKLTSAHSKIAFPLDLSDIPLRDIESITFRIYCPPSTKSNGIRLMDVESGEWIMLTGNKRAGRWAEITLKEGQNFNTDVQDFSVLDDGTGYSRPVSFVLRFTGTDETLYVDSITIKRKNPDTEPPIITYEGETEIYTSSGRLFSIDATAYDTYAKETVEPEYIWSDGALDSNGLLQQGTHQCTVRFADRDGNYADLSLTVHAAEKDLDPPILQWAPDQIYASEGMIPVLQLLASDQWDGELPVQAQWSDGALQNGRLCKGTHTLTLSAADQTGNIVQKTIAVIVESGLPQTDK